MEQLWLFEPPQMLLGRYYRAIKRGDWEKLAGILEALDNPESRPANWYEKKQFWDAYLDQLKKNAKKPATEMALFWEKLTPELESGALQAESKCLQEYWFRLLVSKLDGNNSDYLTAKLHPVDCLLRLGEYEKANGLALRYFKKTGESSRIRTCQSFCLHKMGNKEDARMVLAFAMFYDPLAIESEFIFDESIGEILEGLKSEYSNPRLARAIWPFQAWLDRQVEIPLDAEFADRIVNFCGGDLLSSDIGDRVDARLYFNHLLYVSEMARQSAGTITNQVVDIRKRMQEIDSANFEKYIKRLQSES